MIGYTIRGADELKALLAKMPEALIKATARAFTKIGLLIERHSKILTPVRTGRLRASIFSVVGQLRVTVATNTEYAVYVHNRVPFLTAGAQEVIAQEDPAKIITQELSSLL